MYDSVVREECDAEAAKERSTVLLGALVEFVGDATGGFEAQGLSSKGGGENEGAHECDEVVCHS